MSSEKFENIEDDFNNICREVKKKLESKLPKCWGEEKKKVQREVQKQLEEADALLSDMNNEVKLAPQPFKGQMANKVKNYQYQLSQLSLKLRHSSSAESFNRQELFAGSTNPFVDPIEEGQRTRLLQTNNVLQVTSERITRAQQIAAETDEVGQHIVEELGQQRESLIRTKDKLGETDDALSRSKRILNAMYRRVITNKLILILVILVEIGIFVGILYKRFLK